MRFGQFRVTPVPLDVAAKLAGGDSRRLKTLASNHSNELLLRTGAKLVPLNDKGDAFGVFSYHHDGGDGRKAVEAVLG